jgi:F-type H+-transporting ATPase subunit c
VNKTIRIAVLCLFVAFTFSPAVVVLAQEDAPSTTKEAIDQEIADAVKEAAGAISLMGQNSLGHFGVCIGAGLAAAGGGLGIAILGNAVISASARQPEMRAQLMTLMFIVAALVEGLTLFAIVVCILCLFM